MRFVRVEIPDDRRLIRDLQLNCLESVLLKRLKAYRAVSELIEASLRHSVDCRLKSHGVLDDLLLWQIVGRYELCLLN